MYICLALNYSQLTSGMSVYHRHGGGGGGGGGGGTLAQNFGRYVPRLKMGPGGCPLERVERENPGLRSRIEREMGVIQIKFLSCDE